MNGLKDNNLRLLNAADVLITLCTWMLRWRRCHLHPGTPGILGRVQRRVGARKERGQCLVGLD